MSTAWRNKRGWYSKYVRMRKPFLAERPLCEIATEGVCTGESTQVHHVLGVAVAPLDMRYWMAACKACNLKLGDPTQQDPRHTRTDFFD